MNPVTFTACVSAGAAISYTAQIMIHGITRGHLYDCRCPQVVVAVAAINAVGLFLARRLAKTPLEADVIFCGYALGHAIGR